MNHKQRAEELKRKYSHIARVLPHDNCHCDLCVAVLQAKRADSFAEMHMKIHEEGLKLPF